MYLQRVGPARVQYLEDRYNAGGLGCANGCAPYMHAQRSRGEVVGTATGRRTSDSQTHVALWPGREGGITPGTGVYIVSSLRSRYGPIKPAMAPHSPDGLSPRACPLRGVQSKVLSAPPPSSSTPLPLMT